MRSSCLSQPAIRFQLALFWSTIYKSWILNYLNRQHTLLESEPPVVEDPILQGTPEPSTVNGFARWGLKTIGLTGPLPSSTLDV